jgi:hypothetical protein
MHDRTGEMRRTFARARLAAVAGLVLALALAGTASATTGGVDRQIAGVGSGVNVATFGDPTTFVAEERADLSHLGSSTIHVEGTSTLTAEGAVVLAGNATIVAANGDELTSRLSGTGVMTATGLDATVVGEVVGGTGRFEDASGTLTDHVVLTITDYSPPTVTSAVASSFSGTISY